jgi:hypothetical protein
MCLSLQQHTIIRLRLIIWLSLAVAVGVVVMAHQEVLVVAQAVCVQLSQRQVVVAVLSQP